MLTRIFIILILVSYIISDRLSSLKFKFDLNYLAYLNNKEFDKSINILNTPTEIKESIVTANIKNANIVYYKADIYTLNEITSSIKTNLFLQNEKDTSTNNKSPQLELLIKNIKINLIATFDIEAKIIIKVTDKIVNGPVQLELEFISVKFFIDETGLLRVNSVNVKISKLYIKFNNPALAWNLLIKNPTNSFPSLF